MSLATANSAASPISLNLQNTSQAAAAQSRRTRRVRHVFALPTCSKAQQSSFPLTLFSVREKHRHYRLFPRETSTISVGGNQISGARKPSFVVASAPQSEIGDRIVVGSWEESEGDPESSIRLECDESGCVFVVGKNLSPSVHSGPKVSSSNADAAEESDDEGDEKDGGFLTCDISGCYYSYDPVPPPPDFVVIEGAGWRLGYETQPEGEDSYAAMVGAGGWSIALSANEYNDFVTLIKMLRKAIITMDEDGVTGKEDVSIQVERGAIWMECDIPKQRLQALQKFLRLGGLAGANGGVVSGSNSTTAFDIRFVIAGGSKNNKRQAEGYWPSDAVMDMLKKMDELSVQQEQQKKQHATVALAEPTKDSSAILSSSDSVAPSSVSAGSVQLKDQGSNPTNAVSSSKLETADAISTSTSSS